MGYNVSLHTCNLSKDVKRIRNFFTGQPLNAFDDPGLSPAERAAVIGFLQGRGGGEPDDFGVYNLTFDDGGEAELFARGLRSGARFVGGTVYIRNLTFGVVDFLFGLAEVGRLILTPTARGACPLVTSEPTRQAIESRFSDVKITPSSSALETELRFAFDCWQKHESDPNGQRRGKRRLRVPGTWTRNRKAVEDTVCAFFGALLAVGVIIVSGLVVGASRNGTAWEIAGAWLVCLFCLASEGWFLVTAYCEVRRYWQAIDAHPPLFAVAIALQQPRLPYLLRPLAGLWWIFHFWMGMVLAIVPLVAERRMPLGQVVVFGLFATAFAYLAFVYLLLFVTVFTRRPRLIRWIWRWRGPWAVVHGVFAVGTHVVAVFF